MNAIKQAVADYLAAVDAFNEFENQYPHDCSKRWDRVFDAKCNTLDALRAAFKADAAPTPTLVIEAPAPKAKKVKEEVPFVLEYDKSGYVSTKECARLMRRILNESFPGVKFGVRSHTYSMGSHVDVNWVDGPTSGQVDAVIGEISGKTFNGMDDSYDYHDYLWQGERIHFAGSGPSTSRDLSPEKSAVITPDMSHQARHEAYMASREISYADTQPSTTLALFRMYQPVKVAAQPSVG
jgi:hypothetical protein